MMLIEDHKNTNFSLILFEYLQICNIVKQRILACWVLNEQREKKEGEEGGKKVQGKSTPWGRT